MTSNANRIIIVLFVTSAIMTSCSSRILQIYNVESKQAKPTKPDELLVYEDDTVKVLYNFWEENGRMTFAVYNKLDKPLIIDWKKSNFSLNGNLFPYWTNETRVKTVGNSYSWGSAIGRSLWGFSSYASSSILKRDVEQTHLPPNSWMERFGSEIQNSPDEDLEIAIRSVNAEGMPKKERRDLEKQIIQNAVDSYSLDSVSFSKGQSPRYFRNFLSFTLNDGTTIVKTVDNLFEVQSILSKPLNKDSLYHELKHYQYPQRYYTIRRDMRPKSLRGVKIDYPKNNLFFGYSFGYGFEQSASNTSTLGSLKMVGIEIGYSRLIKSRFELGIAYSGELSFFSAVIVVPKNSMLPLPSYKAESAGLGHGGILQFMYFTNPKRRSRFSIGVKGFFTAFPDLENNQSYGTLSNASLGGLAVELGGNFGGRSFIVNPFFQVGFQNFHSTVKFDFLVNENEVDILSANVGAGLRFRVPLGKKKSKN